MSLKEQIKSLIEQRDYNSAKELLQQLDDGMALDPEVISMHSIIAYEEGNLEEAERLLWRGLDSFPNDGDMLFNLAYIYQIQEKFHLAIGFYESALKVLTDPNLKDLIHKTIESLQIQMGTTASRELELEKPLVSIVVLAYNKLEYTKLCVESIYRFTSHLNFELITVNNGSSDGTREYFDSLPNLKKIHLDENVGPVNGFNIGMKAAEGKYTACVCNDFIYTPRWMDNLLACIESDDKIGFVSPGANYISNHQRIDGKYSNIEEMLQFAEEYNHSNPKLWEERVRLLPCVLMTRTDLLKEVGYFDPSYYFGEFADDDISFRIRRAGYKLVFTRDTFTFHFGSVTTGVDHRENNSLSVSRDIFRKKYGIDAWTDASFDPRLIESIGIADLNGPVRVLGINSKCGGNPLQLKNKLRLHGFDQVNVFNFTEDPKYLIDLHSVSDRAISGQISDLHYYFKGEAFDFILVDGGLETYRDIERLLDQAKLLLQPSGKLIFTIKNASSFLNVTNLIQGRVLSPDNNVAATYLNRERLIQTLQDKGLRVIKQETVREEVPEAYASFVKGLAASVGQKPEDSPLYVGSYIMEVVNNNEVSS